MTLFDEHLKTDFALAAMVTALVMAEKELTRADNDPKDRERCLDFMGATITSIGKENLKLAFSVLKKEFKG